MLRYAITEGRLNSESGVAAAAALATRCGDLVRSGVEVVLVREKLLAAGELARVSRVVIEAVRAVGAGTKVLIARRLDVAIAVGADGVHLAASAGELRVGDVRRLMPDGWVSVSCHTLDEVRRAREDGASAVLFGPVFGKTVDGIEVVQGVGSARLREACEVAGSIPIFGLGGVTEGNAGECVEAGAKGVAGIRMFFESYD